MGYVIPNPLRLIGQAAKGNGECAGLPIALNKDIPNQVIEWRRGERVKGKFLCEGTVIAIFSSNGDYWGVKGYHAKHGHQGIAHTAIYVGQTHQGIWVVHQFGNKPIQRSFIRFGASQAGRSDTTAR